MTVEVLVVDLGVSNVSSVVRAIQRLGVSSTVVANPSNLSGASHVILPGVGSFHQGARQLDVLSLREGLVEIAMSGTQLLGICLGMQLFFSTSEEAGDAAGLGLVSGDVRSLPANTSRIGWDRVWFVETDRNALSPYSALDGDFFYFNHNFIARPTDPNQLLMVTEEPESVPAMVFSRNITGVQFHPEKSQGAGLDFLRAWLQREDSQ